VAAAAIWMITGSVFALLFGLLSPIIAVGSLVDGRRSGRKQRARDAQEYERLVVSLRELVVDRHQRLRNAAQRRTPGATALLSIPAEVGLWRPGATLQVSLGLGTIASGVQLGGARNPLDERELRDWAAVLPRAPMTTDVAGGLGLVGPPALTRALARAVLVQLCFALPPDQASLTVPPGEVWAWASVLPHSMDCGGVQRPDGAALPGVVNPVAGTPPACRLVVGEASAGMFGGGTLEGGTHGVGIDGVGTHGGVTAGRVSLAASEEDLPRGCTTVVRVFGPQRAQIVRSPVHAQGTLFEPELITAQQALSFARVLRDRAGAAGLLTKPARLPAVVAFADLWAGLPASGEAVSGDQAALASAAGDRPTDGLPCPVGLTARGALMLDLARQGPHAVVGGTTGSGKSELLATWVASLAACFGAHAVTFLLVDFKGGAAFGPLADLPHCVGVITDLDAVHATRALASLSAELRYREGVLRDAGVRDVRELDASLPDGPALARLIIVIDEFATVLAAFPALHVLFVDIAARGRSLGVHLILCTQRPAGVVRDALLANCSLRLSLRVNNRADSEAVIGTDSAALLPVSVPGRCLVSSGEGVPVLGQIATTTAADLLSLAARSTDEAALRCVSRPRRPWLDPLPRVLREADLGRGVDVPSFDKPGSDKLGSDKLGSDRLGAEAVSFRFGLIDEPERQRYRVARFAPAKDGHLLVLGDAGSGKSSLLNSLARQSNGLCRADIVVPDIEQFWDALVAASHTLESGLSGVGLEREPWLELDARDGHGTSRARLMLLDDFDAVYARWSPEHQLAALDMLGVLLRDGPGHGITVVLTAQRLSGGLRGVSTLFPSRLLLSLRDRDDYREAGGLAALFDERLPPGGGQWQGARVQLVAPDGDPDGDAHGDPDGDAHGDADGDPDGKHHGNLGAPRSESPGSDAARVDPAPLVDLARMLHSAPLIVVSGAPARTLAVLRRGLGADFRLVDLVGATDLGTGENSAPWSASGRLDVRDATAGTIIVGDADAWQAQWTLLAAVRARATFIFDGCSTADLRLLSHRRDLPPPLLFGRARVWVLSPDGSLARGTLLR
jgi:S-DNA-T family DNA segregation ATPase FtsK/SpoIIIE